MWRVPHSFVRSSKSRVLNFFIEVPGNVVAVNRKFIGGQFTELYRNELNATMQIGEKYLFCVDTKLNLMKLINRSISYTFSYERGTLNRWIISFIQGSGQKTTNAKAWFKDFENQIPPGYFAFADPREFEYVSCRQNQFLLYNLFYFIFFL